MTYDGQSPITGTGIATPGAIDAWFAHKGPAYASYAPDKRYKPAPAIGNSIVGYAGVMRLNSDLVAAQCLHESAAWQSAIARDKNNPAGLGAENDDPYGKAITFLTPDMGIRAQVAHLADYAIGKGDWTQYDPRASAMPSGYFGVAKALNGLDGRWAFPGVGYGASIAALANDLVAFAQTGAPMAGDDPRFQWTPDTDEFGYPQRQHGRNGQPIELLILHITAGTDSQAWLLGGHGSSTHYLTNKDGTPRAQHVADADAAWTPGSRDYALRSINVEVEMLNTSDWTDAIMREVARTIAPIMQRHGIPAVYRGRGDNGPGKRGMTGHRDVPDGSGGWGGSNHHDDPGANFDWGKFTGYVAAELAGGVIIPPDAPPQNEWTPEGNPYGTFTFRFGFYGYVQRIGAAIYPDDWQHGALSHFGYPMADEFAVSGGSVQPCERYVLRYQSGAEPPWNIVGLLRTESVPEAA